MTTENKIFVSDCLSVVKGFGIKENEIVITGSIALDICDLLPESRKVHDFDCFVYASKERIQELVIKIQEFVNDSDGEILNCAYDGLTDENNIYFTLFGKTINIWFYSNHKVESIITYNGIKVFSPRLIIKEKLSYGRGKDYEDSVNIIRRLLEKK